MELSIGSRERPPEGREKIIFFLNDTATPEIYTLSLHDALPIWEGFEFQVSRPRIIPREGPNGERLEPYEELMIDAPEGYLGVVMEKLGPRRGELMDMRNPGRSEEHTSELQSPVHLVCRLLLEKK